MSNDYDDYKVMSLDQLAMAMKEEADLLGEAKKVKTSHQKKWDHLRMVAIPNKLEEMGLDGARVTGVGGLSVRTDAYCSVPAGNREAVKAWLREHGHGDLVGETINSSTFKAFIKEQVVEGNEIPDDLIKFEPYTFVAIVK